MGGMPPGEGMPGGPIPPGFFQVSPDLHWSCYHQEHFPAFTFTIYNNKPIYPEGWLKCNPKFSALFKNNVLNPEGYS